MNSRKISFSADQIETLRREFATAPDRISFDHADRLLALLDSVDDATMEQLAGAGIKFVSSAARGRVLRAKVAV